MKWKESNICSAQKPQRPEKLHKVEEPQEPQNHTLEGPRTINILKKTNKSYKEMALPMNSAQHCAVVGRVTILAKRMPKAFSGLVAFAEKMTFHPSCLIANTPFPNLKLNKILKHHLKVANTSNQQATRTHWIALNWPQKGGPPTMSGPLPAIQLGAHLRRYGWQWRPAGRCGHWTGLRISFVALFLRLLDTMLDAADAGVS